MEWDKCEAKDLVGDLQTVVQPGDSLYIGDIPGYRERITNQYLILNGLITR